MARRGIEIVVTAIASAGPERTFDVIVPIDLSAVFTGFGPMPAVSGTRDQSGDWNAVGQSRRVELSNGSHARERIDAYNRPTHFAYTVGPFSGTIGRLVDHAAGAWWFAEDANGTAIRWSYTWVPRRFAYLPVWMMTRFWRPYAQRVLARAARMAELPA
jgi:Polyketide cyclase / dehydrase and lipid transport